MGQLQARMVMKVFIVKMTRNRKKNIGPNHLRIIRKTPNQGKRAAVKKVVAVVETEVATADINVAPDPDPDLDQRNPSVTDPNLETETVGVVAIVARTDINVATDPHRDDADQSHARRVDTDVRTRGHHRSGSGRQSLHPKKETLGPYSVCSCRTGFDHVTSRNSLCRVVK